MEPIINCLQWYNDNLRYINILRFPITYVGSFVDHMEELNELMRRYPLCHFKYVTRKRTGSIHLAKSYLNEVTTGSQVIGTNSTTTIQLIIHDRDKGWCIVQIQRDKLEQTRSVSGLNALKSLIDAVPALKRYISDDRSANDAAQQAAKKLYREFEGVPANATQYNGQVLNHVWSVDINSAFPYALTHIVPSSKQYIHKLYAKRKVSAKAKGKLNNAIGAMTSKVTTFLGLPPKALSQLRYEILNWHNDQFQAYVDYFESQGAIILNKRIDSIKFLWPHQDRKPRIPNEGTDIGQLKVDFADATYLQISTSKYQYIDPTTNKLKVVISGLTSLDRIKPREDWNWDDIFTCGMQQSFCYDEEEHQFRRNYRCMVSDVPSPRR